MTEAEWLTCEEPQAMLVHLGESTSQRKLRLFTCACFRAGEPWEEKWHQIRDTIPLAEQLADGIANDTDVQRALATVSYPRGTPSPITCLLSTNVFSYVASVGSDLAAYTIGVLAEQEDVFATMDVERAKQTAILRDIFGNPFRPVTFAPAWRTDTAVALARQMYEGRDFGAMPILADALQDAGCDSAEVLSHCRDATAAHVRGCWVVDLVLGKA